jgi:hypothetical protein
VIAPDARLLARLPGEPPAPADLERVRAQIGRLRYVPVRVLRRAPGGDPQVVLSFFGPAPGSGPAGPAGGLRPPSGGGGPLRAVSTNLFWITDPDLSRRVGRLEAAGEATRLRREVLSDPDRAARFLADQQAYHRLAVRLFAGCLAAPPPRATPFGVGGVRSLDQVKCLHSHLAYALATGRSWVGRQVACRLGEPVPPEPGGEASW